MTLFDVMAPTRPMAERAARQAVDVPVAIYGNSWCGITQMTRRALDRAGIEYHYVDLDRHPDVNRKLQLLGRGRARTPLVYVGGEWLMAPGLPQLQRALARHGVNL
jgi:mycoredoxin